MQVISRVPAVLYKVLALWGFALAQPLLQLLASHPTFLLAHDLTGLEIILLPLVLCLLLPLILSFLLLLLARLTRVFEYLIVGVLCCLLLANAFWQFDLPDKQALQILLIAVGLCLAALLTRALYKFSAIQGFVRLTACAALVVFPSLFLLSPAVMKIHTPRDLALDNETEFAITPNIFFLVFDELALNQLLDEQGQIDAKRFPNIHQLSQGSDWYRNVTAVNTRTELAIPAILSGERPDPQNSGPPVYAQYPDNLFSQLSSAYRINAFEPLTDLCPRKLCRRKLGVQSRRIRIKQFSQDLFLVYQHLIYPPFLRSQLPSINQSWGQFEQSGDSLKQRVARLEKFGRHHQLREFLESLEASIDPAFYFIHLMLPHIPYEYLPNGEIYNGRGEMPGLMKQKGQGYWSADAYSVGEQQKRLELQTRYADQFIGQFVERLRDLDLYEGSLLVLSADHGVSIRPNQFRRTLDESNRIDIAVVPLFVKKPDQVHGKVVDDPVQLTDIRSIITNLLAGSTRELKVKQKRFIDDGRVSVPLPDDLGSRLLVAWSFTEDETLELLENRFLNQSIDSQFVDTNHALEVIADLGDRLQNVNRTEMIPAYLIGHLEEQALNFSDAYALVALNGSFVRVIPLVEDAEDRFLIHGLLPAESIVDGHNSLDIVLFWPGQDRMQATILRER